MSNARDCSRNVGGINVAQQPLNTSSQDGTFCVTRCRLLHPTNGANQLLATTSSEFGNLQTLRLALSLAKRNPSLVPLALQEQVKEIVRQANGIVADASRINSETWPESIALAYL